MTPKTREGGPRTAPDLLPGEIGTTATRSDGKEQSDTAPAVVVRQLGGSAFVTVRNRPWGWPDPTREFLNPKSSAVDRYADELRQRLNAETNIAERAEFSRQASRLAARHALPLDHARFVLGLLRGTGNGD